MSEVNFNAITNTYFYEEDGVHWFEVEINDGGEEVTTSRMPIRAAEHNLLIPTMEALKKYKEEHNLE